MLVTDRAVIGFGPAGRAPRQRPSRRDGREPSSRRPASRSRPRTPSRRPPPQRRGARARSRPSTPPAHRDREFQAKESQCLRCASTTSRSSSRDLDAAVEKWRRMLRVLDPDQAERITYGEGVRGRRAHALGDVRQARAAPDPAVRADVSDGFLMKACSRSAASIVHHVAFLSSDVDTTVAPAPRRRDPGPAGREHRARHDAVAEVELRPAGLRRRRARRGRAALRRRGRRSGCPCRGTRSSRRSSHIARRRRRRRGARRDRAAASCGASRLPPCARSPASGRRDLRIATMLGSRRRRGRCSAPGCVAEVHSAGVALLGLAPRWREARQTGAPRVVEWSEGTFVAALAGGRARRSTRSRGRRGSTPTSRRSTRRSSRRPTRTRARACSRCGRSSPTSRSSTYDGVDEQGNAHVDGDLVLDGLLARAARRVVVTYEREVDADPALAAISHLWIDDAVPSPRRRRADRVPPALRRRRGRAGGAVIADLLTGTLAEELVGPAAAAGLRADDAGDRGRREGGASARAPSGSRSRTGSPRWAAARATRRPTSSRCSGAACSASPSPRSSSTRPAGRTSPASAPPGRPKVALIGPRGLPDNNDTPCPLWYLLAAHSGRTLVERVDVVCGPAPTAATGPRTLLSSAGCFDLATAGWRARWLTPGGADQVAEVPGLPDRDAGRDPRCARRRPRRRSPRSRRSTRTARAGPSSASDQCGGADDADRRDHPGAAQGVRGAEPRALRPDARPPGR